MTHPLSNRAAIAGRTSRLLAFNPVGTPERCAACIQDVIDRTGARRIALLCDVAVERARVMETLERFAREVAPALAGTADAA